MSPFRFVSLSTFKLLPNAKKLTGTLYILFKLQEKEEDEAISMCEYILRLFSHI